MKKIISAVIPLLAFSTAYANAGEKINFSVGGDKTSITMEAGAIGTTDAIDVANSAIENWQNHFRNIGQDNRSGKGTTFLNLSKSCRTLVTAHSAGTHYEVNRTNIASLARGYHIDHSVGLSNTYTILGSEACNSAQDQSLVVVPWQNHFTSAGSSRFANISSECRTAYFSVLGRDGHFRIEQDEIAPLGSVDHPTYSGDHQSSFLGSAACATPPPSKVLNGDFNGDGVNDTASYYSTTGQWWVSLGGNTATKWAQFGTFSGWGSQLVGDFNGDGKDDIANFHPGNGTWWVSISGGSSFSTGLWAQFGTASGWINQYVSDFNGDGKDDINNFHPGNSSTWISFSSGSNFSTQRQ